jgi:hypothetical protein
MNHSLSQEAKQKKDKSNSVSTSRTSLWTRQSRRFDGSSQLPAFSEGIATSLSTATKNQTSTNLGPNKPLAGSTSGQVLPVELRKEMEEKLGHDFENVRVHTDHYSNKFSRELGTQAFARGSDLYFAPGFYQPHTNRGKKIIAHELTHVVQQSLGRFPFAKNNQQQNANKTRLEDEANKVASSVANSKNVGKITGTENYGEPQYGTVEDLLEIRRRLARGALSTSNFIVSRYGNEFQLIHQLGVLRSLISNRSVLRIPSSTLNRMQRAQQLALGQLPWWFPLNPVNFIEEPIQGLIPVLAAAITA